MQEMLEEYINKIKSIHASKIILYGAGAVAKNLYKILISNQIIVDGFCVTDINCNLNSINGLPIYQFDKLDFDIENTLILVAFKERGESKIVPMLEQSKWKLFLPMPNTDIVHINEDRNNRPEIEITTKIGCSVNCKYCPQKNLLHSYYKNDKNRETYFQYDDFVKCINKLPKDTIIDFAGFGEPFLNDRCIDMIEYTYKNGFEVTLYTTLVGLKKSDLKRVLSIPFKEVVVHVADNQGYATIPVTDEYLYCLDAFLEAKKENGTLFVDDVNGQCTPHPEVLKRTKGRFKIYRELMDRAGNLVGEEFADLAKADRHGPIICTGMNKLNHNVLLPDGTMVLCCNDFSLQHELGNLLNQNYDEIMNGEMIKYVEHAMKNDDGTPVLCRKCTYAKEIKNKE